MSNKYYDKINQMTFEQAMQELEKVVNKLEGGNGALEEAIVEYEYGSELQKFCEKKLQEAKLKVEKITKDNSGVVTAEQIDLQ
jgi:exodeoxyribonuclease VII small subunit